MRRFATALGRRVLVALLIFAVMVVLSLVLPRVLPGEMPEQDLIQADAAVSDTNGLTGLGLLADRGSSFVNLRFADPPDEIRMELEFGDGNVVALERGPQGWRQRDNYEIRLTSAAERDGLVVLRIDGASASGVAATAEPGGRVPQSGFAPRTEPPQPRFNLADIVLLAILGLTAWFGSKRGIAGEITDLIVVAIGFTLAAILFRPIGAVLGQWVANPTYAMIVSGTLVVLLCVGFGFLLAPRLSKAVSAVTRRLVPDSIPVVGGVAAVLRQLPMLAIFLLLIVDLLLFAWIAPEIRASLIGSRLIEGVSAIF